MTLMTPRRRTIIPVARPGVVIMAGGSANAKTPKPLTDIGGRPVVWHSMKFSETDARNYRVSCEKIARVRPAFQPQWTVRKGVVEIYAALRRHGMTEEAFQGPSYQRLTRVRGLLDSGELDSSLRWREPALSSAIGG